MEPISIIRSADDASFEIELALPQGGCQAVGFSAGPRGYPDPEEIELRVVRGNCFQRIVIPVAAHTVTDPDFAGILNELVDPVIVESCTQ